MADVSIEIGGRRYDVTCRNGEEARLRELAALLDAKAAQARTAMGGLGEVRQLLLAGLLLADELHDARAALPSGADDALADELEHLAERFEGMADRLERKRVVPISADED